MNRFCVGWDAGTVGCCIAAGPYTTKTNSDSGEATVEVKSSSMFTLPLAPTGSDIKVLECVCAIVNQGAGSEVLWGQPARKESKNGTPLLQFPKLTTLSEKRLLEFSKGRGKRADIGLDMIMRHQIKTKKALKEAKWSNVEFLAAGFKAVWKLAEPMLENQFQLSTVFSSTTPFIDIVIPRPSLWRLNDDHNLLQALRLGLKDDRRIASIRICDESHIALFGIAFDEMILEQLSSGQVIAVSDLGGGTCDNASYTIESVEPFRVSEAIESSGAFAGARIMFSEFEVSLNGFVQEFLDTERSLDDWDTIRNDLVESYTRELTNYAWWDNREDQHKFALDLDSRAAMWRTPEQADAEYLLKAGYQLRRGGLQVTNGLIKRLFRPYVNRIGRLIRTQIQTTEVLTNKEVDLLIVVGGFSKSPYLQGGIRSYLTAREILPDAKIRFPPCYDKSTVAKGAARYAADQSLITSRKLKATVGFKQDLIWEKDWGPLPALAETRNAKLKLRARNLNCIVNSIRCLFWKGQTIKDGDSAQFTGNFAFKPPLFAVEQPVYAAAVRNEELEFHDSFDSKYLIIDNLENQIVMLGDMGVDHFDADEFDLYQSNKAQYDADGYVMTEYRITATWHGEELAFVLEVPSCGHFECDGECQKRCPDGCPGQGKILSMECHIGADATFVGQSEDVA